MSDKILYYQGYYCHQDIKCAIVIANDGKALSFELFGCDFYGDELAYMKSNNPDVPDLLPKNHDGCLCDCRFIYKVPQIIMHDNQEFAIIFNIEHHLGKPAPNGGLDDETVVMGIYFKGSYHKACGGWYEDVLLDLKQQLGQDVFFKNCFGCLYSDYSIFGQSAFGSLMCFYGQKECYLLAKDKKDYMALYDNALYVQETFICDDFQMRDRQVGYRG